MAEQDFSVYETESPATVLYNFRVAAGEYLQLKNEERLDGQDRSEAKNAALERMLGRLPYFFKALASENTDTLLGKLVAPCTYIFAAVGRENLKQQDWFEENVNLDILKEMKLLKKEGLGYVQEKYKREQELADLISGGVKAKKGTETEQEKLFRAEIRILIERDKSLSADEKKVMFAALDEATVISYCRDKKSPTKMVYTFGDFSRTGLVATEGSRYGEANNLYYSAARQFSKEFAYKLKSGKIVTAKGEAAKNSKTANAKTQRKIKTMQEKIDALDKKINDNQACQSAYFEKMVKSLNPVFLVQDIINDDGVSARIAQKYGLEVIRQQALDQVIANVYNYPPIWGVYQEQDDDCSYSKNSIYDKAVENEIMRHDGRDVLQKAGQKFFRQMSVLVDAANNDVAQVDNAKVKDIFRGCVAEIKVSLPQAVRKEAMLQEIFCQALTRKGGVGFSYERLDMLNKLLMLEGMKIQLQPIEIKEKFETSSARQFSEAILADMWKNDGIKKRHKLEAFLYHLGAYRHQHPEVKLKDLTEKSEFLPLYREFVEVCYGQKDEGRRLNMSYQEKWQKFVKDKHNLMQADAMYQLLESVGIYGQDVNKVVSKLAEGKSVSEASPVMHQSKHHLIYRRFAGFFGQNQKDLNRTFNDKDNIVDTIALHPALFDVHHGKEHRFDMGEEYLYQKNDGTFFFGAYSGGKKGDTLLMPVVYVENEKGGYEPLMQKDMLVMTSLGTVKKPHIPEQGDGGNSKISQLLDSFLDKN